MNAPRQTNDSSRPPLRVSGLWAKVCRLEIREAWWDVLDAWETRRSFRWWVAGAAMAAAFGAIIGFGLYPHWARRNAVRMARQWIDAGKPAYAAEIVRKGLEADPGRPELWSLAFELAERSGQRAMAVQYARQAFQLDPDHHALALVWASAALQADLLDEARSALARVPVTEQATSGFAQRLLGDLARRENRLGEARKHFEQALKIEGGGGANLLPLGLCLLNSGDPDERRRGLELLAGLSPDPQWGPAAMRALLAESLRAGDPAAMVRWAGALRASPGFAVGDMTNYLTALKRGDAGRFSAAVAQLEKDHLASPETAAQLVGWLDQVGSTDEALAWMATLPAEAIARPPLAVSKAETLRCAGDWRALRDWIAAAEWGQELNFLRAAYGLCAARALGDEEQGRLCWQALRDNARQSSRHALFAGTTLYSWGLNREAEELWWLAAGASNNLSVDALGTLARYYQVQRDAEGQYRAFNQLHQLHPRDDAVSNNLAFFAALTGNREQVAEQIARDNSRRHAGDTAYQSTLAFVLVMGGKSADALKVLEPWKGEADRSPAVAFAYGLALAGTGDKAKARELLERLDPATLTLREIEVVKAALGD